MTLKGSICSSLPMVVKAAEKGPQLEKVLAIPASVCWNSVFLQRKFVKGRRLHLQSSLKER